MYRLKCIVVLIFVGSMASTSLAQAQLKPRDFWQTADAFLKANVTDGKVAYRSIAEDPGRLNQLVRMIGDIRPESLSVLEKKAFYINAYNSLTIHSIIKNEIPDSPMDVDGFFNGIRHHVAGQQLTLDEIEKGILYTEFSDARMHFALVCAANGCPPLQPFAYNPEELDTQLDMTAQTALNDPSFIRVSDEDRTAKISEIFKWYKQDFVAESDSVRDFINRYRNDAIPAGYDLGYYSYDWKLNGS